MSSKPTNSPPPSESTHQPNDSNETSPIEEITPEYVELPCVTNIHQSFSFPSYRRNNIHFVEDDRLVSIVGNTLHFIDIKGANGNKNATYEWFLNENGSIDGIGSICVHPSREYIAVGEIQASKSNTCPNIYIFEYPSMKIVHTLKNGTKRGFTAMAFNASGDQLATVGGDPDYMLTIWNWRSEKIILRYKAFGQDVYNVSFSNYLEGVLTTSGMGHIKFWKMSKTFTGLKLKGDIGKFGKVDMSDINGFLEFPDGKVLSGSEQGDLILWEGNLVKVLIKMDESSTCHQGPIDFVSRIDKEVITAGHDGYLKYWSLEEIDLLEASDTDIVVYLKPIQEFKVCRENNTPAEIITLVRRNDDNVWIIQDGKGSLWKLEISDRNASGAREHKIIKLLDFNSGVITDVITAPNQHVSAAGSSDGTVRLVNHHAGQSLFSRKFNAGVVKVMWNPEVVDPTLTSITCAFADGVIRYLSQGETKWQLVHVLKPHKSGVVSFDYTSDGKIFVTASAEELFFFHSPSFEPVGYTNCKSKLGAFINDMKIHDDYIVLSMQDGRVIKVIIPDLSKIDNSKTYEFDWDKYIPYNFYQWLKPPPKKKKEEEEGDSDDDSEKEDDEEVVPDPPIVPVRSVVFTPDDNLLVSFEKSGGIYRYSGKWWDSPHHKEPEYPFDCLNAFETALVHKLDFSKDGNYLIITYTNGKIRLVDAKTIGTVKATQLSAFNLHSYLDGVQTTATTSFDDSYLISVSSDGGFFVHKIENMTTQESAEILLNDIDDSVSDIISSDHWSIEEARIKNAEIEKERAAMQRQSARREKLENLKANYLRFLKETDSREAIGISREDLQIDTRLQQTLADKLAAKLELARKEFAWDKAKTELQLKKVKDQFFDCLDVERVVLRSFRSGKVVSTFRTRKLREELIQKIEEVHNLINEEMEKKRRYEEEKLEQEFAKLQPSQEHISESDTCAPDIHNQSFNETKKLTSTKKRAEENEKRREERLLARKALEERKPSSEDDPRQVAEIRYAEEHMGDYKLKTDPNFIVPENQRMTTEKKLRQMILLEESVHTLRMVFNQNLFQLKETKAKLIEKFTVYSARIEQINAELRIKEPIVEPSFDISETPELRYHVTDEELEVFKKQKELEMRKKLAAESGKFISSEDVEVTKSGPGSSHSFQSKRSSHGKSHRGKDSSKERMLQSIPVSDMEKMEEAMKRHTLVYEKERLLRRMKTQVDLFDQKVEELRREKFKLEADLKNSDLRLILLYKELELLKEFEMKDSDNYAQLEAKRQERDEIVAKIQNCQDRLAEKKQEISQLVQDQKLGNEFLELVPENHPAHQQLFQVYKKSKKSKKQDSDSETDSDSDEEDDEDDDDDEDDVPTVEKKPEHIDCSEELWLQVVNLRNKRIEQEKNLDIIARSVELLKKEREGLVKQQKVVNHALKKIEEQNKSVQKDKQHKLNTLTTVVVLKFNQIQGLLQNKVPSDLSDYVVFTNGGLNNLGVRISELKKENKYLHTKHIQHQKRVSQLQKEQKIREESLQSSANRVQEVQHLKFGQLVDLEALENASVDMKAEELKELLFAEEQRTEGILKAWDRKINEEKDKLTSVTQENTQLLQALAQYRETQQALEKDLDESQKTIVNRITKSMTEVSNTKAQLKEIVMAQAREIEIAKNEIAILRSKHSHVYRVQDASR